MNVYGITYTMFIAVEAPDKETALNIAAYRNLDDFIFLDAEVEEIKTNEAD